ncbi:MAG: hypothetical protein VX190_04460, partial [Bacteroidota bacterium]|nr:hypothetical protein [Bacteroidota bacterium]
GFLLVKADEGLVSPIGTLFIERYEEASAVQAKLAERQDDIQVVTLRADSASVAALQAEGLRVASFGENQCPTLRDYADGVDTMSFLLTLPKPPVAV